MAHLKRLRTKKTWSTQRKGIKFITRPAPGPHKKEECITLNVFAKDFLKIANTTREVRRMLHEKKILVDGKPRKDVHFPIGVMDVITVPDLNKSYILAYDHKGKFILRETPGSRAHQKTRKITGKSILKKNKLQLNFYDGYNLVADKGAYNTGDSLVMNDKKIEKHLKLEKGATVFLVGGKHIGDMGIVKEIKNFKGMERNRIVVQIGEKEIETLRDYAFVIEPGALSK